MQPSDAHYVNRGRQHRLLTICAAFSLVDSLTLPLSKGPRQVNWEIQRMVERAEEGKRTVGIKAQILATLVTPR